MDRAEAAHVLGVPPDLPPALVRKAWRRRVFEIHPDGDGEGDPVELRRATEARDVLLSPTTDAPVSRSDDWLFASGPEPPRTTRRERHDEPDSSSPQQGPSLSPQGASRADSWLFDGSAHPPSSATPADPLPDSLASPVAAAPPISEPERQRRERPSRTQPPSGHQESSTRDAPDRQRLLTAAVVGLAVSALRPLVVWFELSPVLFASAPVIQGAVLGMLAGYLAYRRLTWWVVGLALVAGIEWIPFAAPALLVAGVAAHRHRSSLQS
jgi:hypothetical protein